MTHLINDHIIGSPCKPIIQNAGIKSPDEPFAMSADTLRYVDIPDALLSLRLVDSPRHKTETMTGSKDNKCHFCVIGGRSVNSVKALRSQHQHTTTF